MKVHCFLPTGLLVAGTAFAAPTTSVVLNFKQAFGSQPYEVPIEWGKNYVMGVPSGGHTGCSIGSRFMRCGTVIKVTPPDAQHKMWRQKLLYRFSRDPDGWQPFGSPVAGLHGHLFVATQYGGTAHNGALIELSPPASGKGEWSEQVIHSFDPVIDGAQPDTRPYEDSSGNLFVMLPNGGASANAYGALVEFSPPPNGQTVWTETVIHTFDCCTDGSYPVGSVRSDGAGGLLATTEAGGRYDGGLAIDFTPPSGGGQWTENILYAFGGPAADAISPQSGLVPDGHGNLFGTAFFGGTYNSGAIYELSPPANGGTAWMERVLYSFTGQADGIYPHRGIILDGAGNIFVTTPRRGDPICDCGTLVRLTPPQSGQGAWTETTLYQFTGAPGGAYPGGLTADDSGNLLIPTSGGGLYGSGPGFGTLMQFSNTGYVVKR